MIRVFQIAILVFVIFFTQNLYAQDSITLVSKSHSVAFKTQFAQFKDGFNYGKVFNGLNLVLGYSFTSTSGDNIFTYSPELGFGPSYKEGIGLAWKFRPIDFFYGWKINKSLTKPLTLGVYFATNYQWQLYPELQSGHMFWFTSIEAGPQLLYIFPIHNRLIKITFSNSIAGWASRPVPSTEKYFYSLRFSDYVKNAHSNLKFGSFNLFNHTIFEIELVPKIGKRLSLAYEFEYFGYYRNPTLSYMSHSFNLRWKIGKLI
jgi:hypothetical protein